MIKMVVFDMAGTTVNEDNIVYKTLRDAINQAGFSYSLEQVLAAGAGKEKHQAIKSILAIDGTDENETLSQQIFSNFNILLKEAYTKAEISAQPNALNTFLELRKRNILIVLNTGYNYETATSLFKKLHWNIGIEIDALVTASDVRNNRP